jgi:hypothetical protein
MSNLTQAAARKCADLANAEAKAGSRNELHTPGSFTTDYPLTISVAFRREIERIDEMHREVLADISLGLVTQAAAKLRADLLPEPEPDVLAEAIQAVWNYATGCEHIPPERARQLRAELAKRGVEVKP